MRRAIILVTLPVLLGAGPQPAPACNGPEDKGSAPVLARTFLLEGWK
jgi:hypothetical protein